MFISRIDRNDDYSVNLTELVIQGTKTTMGYGQLDGQFTVCPSIKYVRGRPHIISVEPTGYLKSLD